jgi:DNA-binding CsgD family transcriptional regulator
LNVDLYNGLQNELSNKPEDIPVAKCGQEAQKKLNLYLRKSRIPGYIILLSNAKAGDNEYPDEFISICFDTLETEPQDVSTMSAATITKNFLNLLPEPLKKLAINKNSPVLFSNLATQFGELIELGFNLPTIFGLPALKEILLIQKTTIGSASYIVVPLPENSLCKSAEEIIFLAEELLKAWNFEEANGSEFRSGDITDPKILSDIEVECMRWLAAGKTVSEVAEITNMTYSNVRYHIEKARTKYGYATRQQTVVRAALDYSLDPMGRTN